MWNIQTAQMSKQQHKGTNMCFHKDILANIRKSGITLKNTFGVVIDISKYTWFGKHP